MASRATAEKWLVELTNLPTASGLEDAVVEWVRRWAMRRDDISFRLDSGGNVHLTQKGQKKAAPVVAVAHMDHPAFVVTAHDGAEAEFEFRGGVNPQYFDSARIDVVSRDGGSGTVTSYDPTTSTGKMRVRGDVQVGDICMWRMPKPRTRRGIHAAPACDDLAGCAAALAALDRARGKPDQRHLAVMLTRAEEMGFVGAIHAAKEKALPAEATILSIETSPALADAPVGGGPIIRVGDSATVFDNHLTNAVTRAARSSGLKHQRKLMDGGACEATAFVTYGYQSTGLCVALTNHHNRGRLAEVLDGVVPAKAAYEEIAFSDFHGLIDLILLSANAMNSGDSLRERLDGIHEDSSRLLN